MLVILVKILVFKTRSRIRVDASNSENRVIYRPVCLRAVSGPFFAVYEFGIFVRQKKL